MTTNRQLRNDVAFPPHPIHLHEVLTGYWETLPCYQTTCW